MADVSQINLPGGSSFNVKDAVARSTKADKVPAPAEYDPTSTYARGWLVTYNNKIYQCNTTISTAEAWNPNHWNSVNPNTDYLHSINPTGNGSFSLNRKGATAIGNCSFAEGYHTTASGYGSHAEGSDTTASGYNSHAEGYTTTASGYSSHAEGSYTTASVDYSHAEGYYTTASGGYGSHAEGNHTTANHKSQHTFGEYNILDDSTAAASSRGNYVEIVGNGTANNSRSNARTLDWDGNEVLAGGLKINGTQNVATQVELTQAEYDALVQAGTVDLVNTVYFITDGNANANSASETTYDNTTSGLSATNVQGAIDAIDSTVDNIGILKNGTMSGSVACANDTVTEVGSVILDAGIYLLVGGINWAANATGFRQVAFADGLNPARPTATTTAACSGSKQVFVQVIQLVQVTVNNTTIKLYGWQNSGSSLTAYPFITTARLR